MYTLMNNKVKMEKLVSDFASGVKKTKRLGNFVMETDRLIYQRKENRGEVFNRQLGVYETIDSNTDTDVIAIKTENGTLLGNASILPNIGLTTNWGNKNPNRSQTEVQRAMERNENFKLIPFSVFEAAGLNIQSFTEIQAGKPELVTRKIPNPAYHKMSWIEKNRNDELADSDSKKVSDFVDEKVHFMGNSLFTVGDKYFLFDLDRVELKHKLFNPFLVQIPKKVTTIKQAYDSLVPKAVKLAKTKGKKVIRQGEWFFIPVGKNEPKGTAKDQRMLKADIKKRAIRAENEYSTSNDGKLKKLWGEKVFNRVMLLPRFPRGGGSKQPTVLRAGKNRPNNAEDGRTIGEKSYVTGKITHSGREHKPIELKGWYEVVPNTAIGSFTITGDID
jgi:hypothetical protein